MIHGLPLDCSLSLLPGHDDFMPIQPFGRFFGRFPRVSRVRETASWAAAQAARILQGCRIGLGVA